MTYLVYRTLQCDDDLRRHTEFNEAVTNFASRIESAQSTAMLDRFPPPFLKKRIGRARLIIEQIETPRAIVLAFARMLYRGDAAYTAFCARAESIRGTYSVDSTDLDAYVSARLSKGPPRPLALSDIEAGYLEPSGTGAPHSGYGTVLETAAWVSATETKEYEPYLSELGKLVEQFVAAPSDEPQLISDGKGRGPGVFACRVDGAVVLLGVVAAQTPSDEDELKRRYAAMLELRDPVATLRACRRSYPALVALDNAKWIAIQQSREANLALSAEEAAILESIRRPEVPGARAYPLFINGRPGSGKSTVLQYLFADQLYSHLVRDPAARMVNGPLYLTYSAPLLSRAREVVRQLLEFDAGRSLEKALSKDDIDASLKSSFYSFKEFMRSRLPREQSARFTDSRYIDYPAFRAHYQLHVARSPDRRLRALGPEVAWHVIRSFIKGMSGEGGDFFDAESYREHPVKRKTVTEETFDLVHDRIWSRWYQPFCETGGYWDDQDLTRAVLDTQEEIGARGDDVALPAFPAVFCDEAQDFTDIELEFIFGLSAFARRAIPSHRLNRVPFAFAGDPLQTLNPTGFSWNSVRSSFHEKIVENIDRTTARSLEFNFRELGFNYRSVEPVVKMCNSVQLLRGIVLESKGLTPQKTWFNDPASIPAWYREDDAAVRLKLREEREVIIIVPCHEGGEADFVRNDRFLSEFAIEQKNGEDHLTRNVFSPMRAKGLEFSRVVLYKFGEAAASDTLVSSILFTVATDSMSRAQEDLLPVEYFLNRLYVAASRARSRLLVVDSSPGLEFWRRLAEQAPGLLARYRDLHTRPEDCAWEESDLGGVIEGSVANWEENRDRPEDLAAQFLDEARRGRDIFLLQRALALYEQLGDRMQARRCEALTVEYGGRLDKAAERYAEIGDDSEALRCWWIANSLDAIAHRDWPRSLAGDPRIVAARFQQHAESVVRSFQACDQFLDQILSFVHSGVVNVCSDERWMRILRNALASFVMAQDTGAAGASSIAPAIWQSVISRFKRLGLDPLPATEAAAQIAYRANDYPLAASFIRKLELGGADPMKPWVVEVLADTEPYPANVRYLAKLARSARIVEVFRNAPQASLSDEQADRVVDALMKHGSVREAITLMRRYKRTETLGKFLGGRLPSDASVATEALDAFMSLLQDEGRWEDLLTLLRTGGCTGLPSGPGTVVALVPGLAMRRRAIALFARSAQLAAEPKKTAKDQVSEFLRGELARQPDVGISEGAAAIEHAGRHVDALQFYERLIDAREASDEIHRFARERWALNKGRQAAARRDENQRRRDEVDLARFQEKWNISSEELNNLPDFPDPSIHFAGEERLRPGNTQSARNAEVTRLPEPMGEGIPGQRVSAAPPNDMVTFELQSELESFEGVHFVRGARVEIRRRSTKEVVVLNVVKRAMRSADLDREDIVSAFDGDVSTFRIPSWGLECNMHPEEGATVVEIAVQGGTSTQLRC